MSDVFFVTGCASGIGRHLVRALSHLGHAVVATDVNEVGLAEAAKAGEWPEARVLQRRLDVRSQDDWQASLDAAVARFGHVDVLLNVAGYLLPGWCDALEPAQIDRHLDVNVKGTINGVTIVGRYLAGRGQGHVINIGSLASMAPVPGLSLYSASKYAVRGFTLAAAQELGPKGVKVTLVMPDAVETPMLDLQVGYAQAAMTFSGGRTLTVEDIERAILDEVLPHAPLELTIPFFRGALSRFATFLPSASMWLGPLLSKKGRATQERRKRG